jgi:hypothetical protein
MKKMLIVAGVTLFAVAAFAQDAAPAAADAAKTCVTKKCCAKASTPDCCKAKVKTCPVKAKADAEKAKADAAKAVADVKTDTAKAAADVKVDAEKAKEETKSWWKFW